jgi:hypothetical protein
MCSRISCSSLDGLAKWAATQRKTIGEEHGEPVSKDWQRRRRASATTSGKSIGVEPRQWVAKGLIDWLALEVAGWGIRAFRRRAPEREWNGGRQGTRSPDGDSITSQGGNERRRIVECTKPTSEVTVSNLRGRSWWTIDHSFWR